MSSAPAKRSTDPSSEQQAAKKPTSQVPSDPLQAYFTLLSQQNDANNDRRERLIRLSREVTRQSKKVISLLQRVGSSADDAALVRQAHEALAPIRADLKAKHDEIASAGQDVWRHKTSWSGGVQEYLEAASFLHFIETGTLLTMEQAAQDMAGLPLHLDDYLGGISDLSGELMRVCVSAGGSNKAAVAHQTCAFVREMRSHFALLAAASRDMGKKVDVMDESLRKMEQVCFQLRLREAEIFPQMAMTSLAFDAAEPQEADE